MMLPSFSSQQPLCSRGNKNIFRPTRFIIHRTKISEFLLVRTNSKIFPQSRTPSCVHANGSLDEQARVELDTVIKHTSPHTRRKKNPPLRQIGKTFSSSAIIRQFSPTCDPTCELRDRSSIMIVPINDYVPWKSPVAQFPLRERSVGPLPPSLSPFRAEEGEGSCACGWAITPFPSPSTPTRSDNIIIGFNLR